MSGDEDPFERLEDVPDRDGDSLGEAEDVFEDRGVGAADPDAVWDRLAESPSSGGEEGTTARGEERTTAEVSKHSYCEQCRYFSVPPGVSCSHEGTDILSFPDMETVRVADCPVVEERKTLEEPDGE
jgi:hypothetical protein